MERVHKLNDFFFFLFNTCMLLWIYYTCLLNLLFLKTVLNNARQFRISTVLSESKWLCIWYKGLGYMHAIRKCVRHASRAHWGKNECVIKTKYVPFLYLNVSIYRGWDPLNKIKKNSNQLFPKFISILPPSLPVTISPPYPQTVHHYLTFTQNSTDFPPLSDVRTPPWGRPVDRPGLGIYHHRAGAAQSDWQLEVGAAHSMVGEEE